MTNTLEQLLKKAKMINWTEYCEREFATLKEKMVNFQIILFPDQEKCFHVHVEASSFSLRVKLAQTSRGNIDHPI